MAEKGNRCGNCRHFVDDPAVLEELFKGIGALSSTRGESRGDAGVCRLHDRYLLPVHSCEEFAPEKQLRLETPPQPVRPAPQSPAAGFHPSSAGRLSKTNRCIATRY